MNLAGDQWGILADGVTVVDDAQYGPCHLPQEEVKHLKDEFQVTPELCFQIERETRLQTQSSVGYQVRVRRITSSKCGRILMQRKWTPALLKSCLYPKPLYPLPQSIAWGIRNEPVACQEYATFQNTRGHPDLSASPSGFVIHSTLSWLGASPDARVMDPSVPNTNGIAEFKCPFSHRTVKPEEACNNSLFCGEMVDGQFRLKRKHTYYHQIQLQLFVGSDLYTGWCDFALYTPVGMAVERIEPDQEWQKTI